eukprot:CAMPEP_0183358786 /NCGR_PEP_ID=MMETSP0164_2-20130417/50306_1 /TAXON_ID=221442 /ORGANISM="Coccolithus pelagicus ssp braarudi, Strain PLY182g" /LENGTH=158 /DNA_ID=CAMNT_0025532743 /DNA_START=114 /DNA_END=589 /DNA_ORIENTATION=-
MPDAECQIQPNSDATTHKDEGADTFVSPDDVAGIIGMKSVCRTVLQYALSTRCSGRAGAGAAHNGATPGVLQPIVRPDARTYENGLSGAPPQETHSAEVRPQDARREGDEHRERGGGASSRLKAQGARAGTGHQCACSLGQGWTRAKLGALLPSSPSS